MLMRILERWKQWSCAIFPFLLFFFLFRIILSITPLPLSDASAGRRSTFQNPRITSGIQAQASQPEVPLTKEEVQSGPNLLLAEKLPFSAQDVQTTQPNSQLQVRQGKIAVVNGHIWEIYDVNSASSVPMTVHMPPITKALGDPQPGYFVQFEAVACADSSWYATTFCYSSDGPCTLAPEEFGWRAPAC